jgi:hypothetical protein
MNNMEVNLQAGNIISIKVPINLKRPIGRKTLILPDGSCISAFSHHQPDEVMLKALAKAYYWQRQIYKGVYASIEDLSKRKKINASYVSRILRLNYLCPQIKQAVMDGTQPRILMLQNMLNPFPDLWTEQMKHFGFMESS